MTDIEKRDATEILRGMLELPLPALEAVESLTVTTPVPSTDNTSLGDRIRTIWTLVSLFAEDAVVVAERVLSDRPGAEKKAAVIDAVMSWLRRLEDRFDWLPDWIQGVLFRGIRLGLGLIVERAFGDQLAAGAVTSG